jgi:hypothetical protein
MASSRSLFNTLFFVCAAGLVTAARPWLNEPDTGITTFLGNDTPAEASGTLIPLDDIVAIPDFEFAARSYMNDSSYSYYRTGAAGEYGQSRSFHHHLTAQVLTVM